MGVYTFQWKFELHYPIMDAISRNLQAALQWFFENNFYFMYICIYV